MEIHIVDNEKVLYLHIFFLNVFMWKIFSSLSSDSCFSHIFFQNSTPHAQKEEDLHPSVQAATQLPTEKASVLIPSFIYKKTITPFAFVINRAKQVILRTKLHNLISSITRSDKVTLPIAFNLGQVTSTYISISLLCFLDDVEYLTEYMCPRESVREEAFRIGRRWFSKDELGFEDPSKYIMRNMKIFKTKDKGFGLVWTGEKNLPSDSLILWYFGTVFVVNSDEDKLPEDTT